MYRRGLAASLAELPGVRDVREADTPADALPALAAAGRAVTVVDHDATRPPGELRTLCAAASGPVLLCLVEAREDDVVGWVEDGVVGFLEKDTLTPEVLRADVQAALAGSGVMAPDLLGRVMDGIARASHDVLAPRGLTLSMLTARERRVLALLADGASTREVAVAMCYSERTVKAISHDIATKFGARTRTQAVARAVRAGII
jgi:DNA-binding NarL/FixJ family response regulator